MTGAKDQSDEALARLAQRDRAGPEGQRAASELFGRYQQRIYLWCFRYTRDHEQALDLAQDVMLSAYRNLPTFSGARVFSWLFAITRNRCLNAMRKPPILRDEGIELERLPASDPGPDTLLEEKLDERAVLRAVEECLEKREQEALYLRCFERMPVDEITKLLAIQDASGARVVLQKARRKLRRALENREE